MGYVTRPLGLGFLALMIIIAFQITTKKGLCMDSNIVYKIDNIESENTESMYACKMHRKVNFSVFFYEQQDQISSRLAKVELLLHQIGAETPLYIRLTPENLDSIEKSVLVGALGLHLRSGDDALVNLLADFLTHTVTPADDMLSSAWWPTYEELSFGDRLQFYDFVLLQLKDRNADIQSFRGFPQFAKAFYQRLDNFGAANSKFDFIFETENPEFQVKELMTLTRKNPNVRVALKNSAGTFVLPFMVKYPDMLPLTTQYRFVVDKKVNVAKYEENTEHLIILNSDNSLKFASLFNEGAAAFLSSNRKLDFIQIHLPSYKLKEKEMHNISDYFDFIKSSKMVSEWVRDRKAFKPVAAVDAIQYYRINSLVPGT